MSKQLTISASIAVMSMALFAMFMTQGNVRPAADQANATPTIGMTVGQ